MNKKYTVSFDMKFSHYFDVEAKNATEAKTKAFAKFKKIRDTQSQYNIDVEIAEVD